MADPHDHQHHTRKNGRNDQSVRSVLCDDPVDDDDKCRRRATDLHTASTEKGNKKSRNDRRIKSLLRADAGRDGKRDRERQRNDCHDNA